MHDRPPLPVHLPCFDKTRFAPGLQSHLGDAGVEDLYLALGQTFRTAAKSAIIVALLALDGAVRPQESSAPFPQPHWQNPFTSGMIGN